MTSRKKTATRHHRQHSENVASAPAVDVVSTTSGGSAVSGKSSVKYHSDTEDSISTSGADDSAEEAESSVARIVALPLSPSNTVAQTSSPRSSSSSTTPRSGATPAHAKPSDIDTRNNSTTLQDGVDRNFDDLGGETTNVATVLNTMLRQTSLDYLGSLPTTSHESTVLSRTTSIKLAAMPAAALTSAAVVDSSDASEARAKGTTVPTHKSARSRARDRVRASRRADAEQRASPLVRSATASGAASSVSSRDASCSSQVPCIDVYTSLTAHARAGCNARAGGVGAAARSCRSGAHSAHVARRHRRVPRTRHARRGGERARRRRVTHRDVTNSMIAIYCTSQRAARADRGVCV
jgi:hypothetical protein